MPKRIVVDITAGDTVESVMANITRKLPGATRESADYQLHKSDIAECVASMCDKADTINFPGTTINLLRTFELPNVTLEIRLSLPRQRSLFNRLKALAGLR